jgi:hypothetical protein
MPIEPATTAVMNPAAPINSPTAKLPLCELIAAKVEKTSGLPFPKAKNVVPAIASLIPNVLAIVLRFTQKKSAAAMPIVENRRPSHKVRIVNAIGFTLPKLQ